MEIREGTSTIAAFASGDLVERYDYTPYGQLQNAPSGSTNPCHYTGREQDESGLYYYRARYYSPDMGRFISEDSWGFASGDANFYAYTLGNPISYNDPWGHIAWFVLVPLNLQGIGTGGVDMAKEFDGTRTQALMLEQMKIDNFHLQNGQLPPGNKVRR
ncbi:RHS repeat-associated core domain-containing protein [Xanthomonas sp. LMG 12462]|uniref:RHS repeat-associated core domain-containing protein n=1 Tax=Xanthomonas sp. LMG 12462 TaxID=1591134 RepID=UPI001D048420|nr:RHS repeat-associated core domain-containing protein [Xanthomonas sp. LMG 12462]